ncbi:MAG: hypothetical protein MRY78_04060 [Saprospiraceae bacterium]|nr:hypothetical protein [Saprospiraceae bacterium]
MLSAQKDQLFLLIKSLSKAEKRNFKIYAKRHQGGSDTKFVQLFEVLDKIDEYDEEAVLKKLPDVQKKQLSNLKRHLFKQVLTSLRLIHNQRNIDIQIREQLDFARILYGKGMYMQALKILERIKKIAVDNHQDILHLEILEFQKLIEARHITRSRAIENKMELLLVESHRRSSITHETSRLSNFNIQIHGYYIENGHIQSEADRAEVNRFFKENVPQGTGFSRTTFFEKANLFQAFMWYHYILLNFKGCCENAQQLLNLFYIEPQMREKDPDLYFRSLYYALTFSFIHKDYERFNRHLQEFESIFAQLQEELSQNSEMMAMVYLFLCQLNSHLLHRSYQEGLRLAPKIKEQLPQFEGKIDIHRLLLIYYKLGYLHFALGQYDEAIEQLNDIIMLKGTHLRDDLLLNARLLQIICHFELGNFSLVDYLIPSLSRLLKRSREANQLQLMVLKNLQQLNKTPEQNWGPIFENLDAELQLFRHNIFEQKSIIFFDPQPWIDHHLGVKERASGSA